MSSVVLPSIVNVVQCISVGERKIVRKVYGDCAVKRGIPVPIHRSTVEARVVAELGRCGGVNSVRAPALLAEGQRFNVFSFLPGKQLDQLSEAELRAIPAFHWAALGHWLRRVECFLYSRKEKIFGCLMDTQLECGEIMRALKTPALTQVGGGSVSLGDVGVKNLLWDGVAFSAVDFEFAHLCASGRDVAQLSCQLYFMGVDVGAIVGGYIAAGGSSAAYAVWFDAFKGYYGKD